MPTNDDPADRDAEDRDGEDRDDEPGGPPAVPPPAIDTSLVRTVRRAEESGTPLAPRAARSPAGGAARAIRQAVTPSLPKAAAVLAAGAVAGLLIFRGGGSDATPEPPRRAATTAPGSHGPGQPSPSSGPSAPPDTLLSAGPGGTAGPGGDPGGRDGRDGGGGVGGAVPPDSAWGYVYVDGYGIPVGTTTLDTEWQWSTGGRHAVLTHSGTGAYRVVLPGLASPTGMPEVTAFWYQARTCAVRGYAVAGADETVDVGCVSATGAPADTRFHLYFGAPARGQPTAVAARWDGALAGVDSTGGDLRAQRLGTGRYALTATGAALDGTGYVQVSAYGAADAHCQSTGATAGGGELRLEVACYRVTAAATPQPVDSGWLLHYLQRTGIPPRAGLPGGYAQVSVTGGPAVDAARSWNSAGGAITVARVGTGNRFRVTLLGMAQRGDVVQVTTLGGAAGYCVDGWWNSYQRPGDEWVDVYCYDAAGRPADLPFGVLVVRAP